MKKIVTLLLVFCMVLSLTGCKGKQEEVKPDSDGKTVENGVDTDSSKEPVREAEITVMMSFPQYMEQWEEYCKQFEEKMLAEENIKVKVNLEMPSSDQYETILQARLSSNDGPDLYTLHSNNIGTYYAANNLTDLSEQPLAGNIYEDVKKTVSHDGKLLAVPIESQAWGVLYNKEIFNQYNIQIPNTLSELAAVCETLKENGQTPFMLAYQEQWVPQLMTALTLGGKVSGDVTDWVERMYEDKASYEEVSEIFDVIDLIMANGTSRAMEEGSEAGSADFANGAAAMYVQGTWASGTIMNTNPDMQLGVFALPINEDENCTRVNLSTSTTLAVYPQSKEMDIALAFANYVLDDKDSSGLFQSCSFNPLANSHNYEAAPWVEDASEYVAAGRSYQDLVLPSAVTEEQGMLLQEYYVGNISKEQIIERLDTVFKEANALSKLQ